MTANRHGTHRDLDDDAPDLSTPEWVDKFMNAPVNPGEPIDPNPISVTTLADGLVRMTFNRLDQAAGQASPQGAPSTKPATARKGSPRKKQSTA